jgi:hypothetical protein
MIESDDDQNDSAQEVDFERSPDGRIHQRQLRFWFGRNPQDLPARMGERLAVTADTVWYDSTLCHALP